MEKSIHDSLEEEFLEKNPGNFWRNTYKNPCRKFREFLKVFLGKFLEESLRVRDKVRDTLHKTIKSFHQTVRWKGIIFPNDLFNIICILCSITFNYLFKIFTCIIGKYLLVYEPCLQLPTELNKFSLLSLNRKKYLLKPKTICATNGAVYYAATPPTPTINNIPIEQFATAVYPPGVPTIYPPTMTPYQPFYQYYSVPMVNHHVYTQFENSNPVSPAVVIQSISHFDSNHH